MTATNRLAKMYLFNEDTFKKLKERLAEEKKFNELDKAMKKVLSRKMSSSQKWLLYQHELQKFMNYRRRMVGEDDDDDIKRDKKTRRLVPPIRKQKTYNMSTDTLDLPSRISTKKHMDTQTVPNARTRMTQTNICHFDSIEAFNSNRK